MRTRQCEERDVPALMAFLGEAWRSDHVLAQSRELMDWQHRQADGGYSYLLAEDEGGIVGAIGYIQASRFDASLSSADTLWIALWVVRPDRRSAAVGLRLLAEVRQHVPHAFVAVNGLNPAHPPLYHALGFTVVSLAQHYAVNEGMQRILIEAPRDATLPRFLPGSATVQEVTVATIDDAVDPRIRLAGYPEKTPRYFRTRFLEHPFYRYRVHRLRSGGAEALIASRVAESAGARALRIVDFAGPPQVLADAGSFLAALMAEEEAEYTDLLQSGLPEEVIAESGMRVLDPQGPVIVPNHFEPLVRANARPLCAVRASTGASEVASFRVLRADGDQDRPNRMPA